MKTFLNRRFSECPSNGKVSWLDILSGLRGGPLNLSPLTFRAKPLSQAGIKSHPLPHRMLQIFNPGLQHYEKSPWRCSLGLET
jgi:hypothetical protein